MDTKELRAKAEPAAWNIHAKGWGEELRFSEAGAEELAARLRTIAGVKEPKISRLYSEADFLSLLDELERTRSSNEAMRKAADEAVDTLRLMTNDFQRQSDEASDEGQQQVFSLLASLFSKAHATFAEALPPSTKVNHE